MKDSNPRHLPCKGSALPTELTALHYIITCWCAGEDFVTTLASRGRDPASGCPQDRPSGFSNPYASKAVCLHPVLARKLAVRGRGFEPPWDCSRYHLKVVRLPVSPPAQLKTLFCLFSINRSVYLCFSSNFFGSLFS